jgi:hypothetical protein
MRVVRFLMIILQDYEAASEAAHRAAQAMNDTVARVDKEDRPLSDDERVVLATALLSIDVVHLRIETFYVFAKILLDKIAHGIEVFFGPVRAAPLTKHSQLLTRKFDAFIKGHGLPSLPALLREHIIAVDEAVVTYRDRYVTHEQSLRTTKGASLFFETGETTIKRTRVVAQETAEVIESASPRALMELLDIYLVGVLEYLCQNKDRRYRDTRGPTKASGSTEAFWSPCNDGSGLPPIRLPERD